MIDEVTKESGNIPSITLLSNDNYSDRCSFIASQLSNLGLDVKIEIMQPALLREQMSNSNASFFWATWIADYPDAESYLTMFYGKNTAPPNYTRFKNEALTNCMNNAWLKPMRQKKLPCFNKWIELLLRKLHVSRFFMMR